MAEPTKREGGGSDPTIREPGSRSAETIREGDSARPAAGTGGGWLELRLPPELEVRYAVDGAPLARGGEAIIFPVRALADGASCVLKLYHAGTTPDEGVLSKVRDRASREHVVHVVEFGSAGGHFYEVLERVPFGSLQQWIDRRGGAFPEEQVEAILDELVIALSHLAELSVVHRDLTPANILIRTEAPLDLVLTDFGISRSLEQSRRHTVGISGTLRYMAPEQLGVYGMIGERTDSWALGLIVALLLTGRQPLADLPDHEFHVLLRTKPVPLFGLSRRWETLCRGLLVRDPDARWGMDEVRRWRQNDPTLPPPSDVIVLDAGPRGGTSTTYAFEDQEFVGPREWARGFAENWPAAVERWARKRIQQWVAKYVTEDQNLLSFVDQLDADRAPSNDAKLSALIARLDPTQPPIFRGLALTPANLRTLALRVVRGEAEARSSLEEIFRHGVLQRHAEITRSKESGALGERWAREAQSYVETRAAAERQGAPAGRGADAVVVNAAVLVGILDAEYLQELRDRMGAIDAARVDWFCALGPAKDASVGSLVLMREFEPGARAEEGILARREAREARLVAPRDVVAQRAADARRPAALGLIGLGAALALVVAALVAYPKWERHQTAPRPRFSSSDFRLPRTVHASGSGATGLELTISPRLDWSSTGLRAYPGDRIRWETIDSTYTHVIASQSNPRRTEVTPLSTSGIRGARGWSSPARDMPRTKDQYPAQDLPLAALVGRMGDGQPFPMGAHEHEYRVPRPWTDAFYRDRTGQPLSIALNLPAWDGAKYRGTVKVRVRIDPGSSPAR